jgi:hypothetical protein
MTDRPLDDLKTFSVTISKYINDLPTTSPHGSYSDARQRICGLSWIRKNNVAQQRHTTKAMHSRQRTR